jgi:NADH-ubiquinone oxidoreductase chain 5
MEGPTPVSALIHAATMVTAGVYLLIRSSPLIEYSDVVLNTCL